MARIIFVLLFLMTLCFMAGGAIAAIFEDTGYGHGGAEFYDEWDLDGDGSIQNDEFYLHSFGSADFDDDGLLDRDEWYDYTTYWYEPYGIAYEDFSHYDIDGSGYLDADEYGVIVAGNTLYSYWDRNSDGAITNDEYNRAMGVSQDYGAGTY